MSTDRPKREAPRTRWQFTWFNFPENYDEFFLRMYKDGIIKGVVCQVEICPTKGTEHLQGFALFKKQYRLAVAKSKFPDNTIHLTPVGGDPGDLSRSIAYCKKLDTRKEGTSPLEIGNIGQKPGTRTDYEPFKADVAAGMTWGELQDKHCSLTDRSGKWCYAYYGRHRPKPPPEDDFEPHDWHKYVNDAINNPDRRKIHFIVDEVGGVGKSYFCRYLESTRDDVQLFKPAKLDSMQYLASEDAKVFLIDCPRSRMDVHLPYEFLESLKDGHVLSTKYEPQQKYLQRINSVIVFMNEVPDTEKISIDRFVVWFRRKAGWSRAYLHPEAMTNHEHRGKWVIPPVDGDEEGETIYRVNNSLAFQSRKRQRETIQDDLRKIQRHVAKRKMEELGISCDISHYDEIEPIAKLE